MRGDLFGHVDYRYAVDRGARMVFLRTCSVLLVACWLYPAYCVLPPLLLLCSTAAQDEIDTAPGVPKQTKSHLQRAHPLHRESGSVFKVASLAITQACMLARPPGAALIVHVDVSVTALASGAPLIFRGSQKGLYLPFAFHLSLFLPPSLRHSHPFSFLYPASRFL